MSLSLFPQPWLPNAIYQLGDRVTLRTSDCVFVLRCEKGGKGGLRPPRVPQYAARISEHQHLTEVVKIHDAQCEWWLERAVRKTHAPRE